MQPAKLLLWPHGRSVLVVLLLLCFLPWTTPAHAASFTVDWPYDEFDANPGDGVCMSAPSGGCTLRAAVQEAEAKPASAHTIDFAAGFTSYQLIHGDLDIVTSTNLSIVGNGPGQTIISSDGSDRIIEIGPDASLSLYKVTLTGGRAKSKPTFTDYRAHAHGGAIHNHGSLTLVDSTVTTNSSDPSSAAWGGGGISNAGAVATADLVNVTLADNTTRANGGGLENSGTTRLYNVTIVNNSASGSGAGVYNSNKATLYNTILAANTMPGNMTNNCAGSQPITSGGYNLTSDTTCNFSAANHDVINMSQYFDTTDRINGIYRLLSGPAVDGGYPGSGSPGVGCPALDQLGASHYVDGDGNGVARCDMGAVELRPIDLSISMTDSPDPVVVGQPLVYTLKIINNGPEPALYVTMFVTLPAGVSFNKVTSTLGNAQLLCGLPNGGVNCDFNRLNNGDTATFWIEVIPTTAGSISNTAQVGAAKPDRNLTNNTATASTVVNAAPNLLQNPGFEMDVDGDTMPDNWTTSGQFMRNDTVVHSGAYSGMQEANDNSSYTVSQTIAGLTTGKTYTFSGYVQIAPAVLGPFSVSLEVEWIDSGGNTISTDTIKTYTHRVNRWDLATKSLVAPTGAAKGQVQMVVSGLNGTIFVDDFAFK
jgi:uncharacterized repeat protein (TIGR01451 family)